MKMMSTHTIRVVPSAPLPPRASRVARGLWLVPRGRAGFMRLLTHCCRTFGQFHITDRSSLRHGYCTIVLYDAQANRRSCSPMGSDHIFDIGASTPQARNDEVVMS